MRLNMVLASILLVLAGDAATQDRETSAYINEVVDPARDRTIAYRFFYTPVAAGTRPLILVSHGGFGNIFGHLAFDHLGEEYASQGYLSLHINHRRSVDNAAHLRDRPADVSHILDRIEAGTLPLPPDFNGTINTQNAGHIGHSYGAYTAHAVAGAAFTHGAYRDTRIAAIVALSPQGEDQFGAFDNGQEDSTWSLITIPAMNIIGGEELDSNALGVFRGFGWRLRPFQRYPLSNNKYAVVIPDQDHSDIGGRGGEEVQAYIAQNSRLFFDVYLRGANDQESEIGTLMPLAGTAFFRQGDGQELPIRGCGPPSFAALAVVLALIAVERRWTPAASLDLE